ncbi:hypothetical protein BJY52DRAFT_1262197 [Lactarius psammicola]|nr:hypothetical protein BJY52DRAFT_1262197 [Lactarius psammicola]
MTSVHFKLSISNGLTRRISFPTRPSWHELAARIQALYNIPLGRLGVSYVDSDGDEVTLSSEEELRDFYDTVDTGQGSQLIKFRVVELSSGRIAELMAEATTPPPRSSIRNTFGSPNPLVFDVDQDWERLPLGGLYIPSMDHHEMDSPHAFVEVVDDEVEKDNGSGAGVGSPPIERANTGRTRHLRTFVEDDVSSSTSVIAEEAPTKPPIHVQVHGLRPMNSSTFGSPPAASTPAQESMTSTPTALPATLSENPKAHPSSPGPFPDPPTPELGDPIDPNISLSNDLASLLNSLNSMNVGSGSYWNAQRDTVARVAEDIQRVARDAQTAVTMGAQEVQRRAVHEARQVQQQAQQEAARRVTEAVGNILRVFGVGGAGPSSEPGAASPGTNIPQVPEVTVTPSSPIETHTYPKMSPPTPPGGFPPHHASPSVANPRDLSSQPPLSTGSTPSTGIPPPLPSGVPPPPRIVPPPPLVNVGGAPAWNQFKPFSGASPDTPSAGPSSSVAPPEVSYYAFSTNRRTRPSASELKASLEAAKANYKAKKDEYRQEQETRRRERRLAKEGVTNSPISPGAQPVEVHTSESMGPSDAGTSRRIDPTSTSMPPPIQIISNARGSFPQLEMVNLPRSPTKQRGDRTYQEGDKARHVDTVVERLEGMGFHEATYPTLRTVVESHLPSDGTRITKEVEDDVMSEILERLLENSGSGMHTTS